MAHRLPPGVELKVEQNGVIVPRSWQFRTEAPDLPALTELRSREKLDEVVAAGQDEFAKMRLLCDWVNSQWKNSSPNPYPPWNANLILSMIRSGQTGGFCAQYAVVFAQACLSLGWQARYLDILPKNRDPAQGHFTVEVWSNQHNQWAVLDPFFDCYFEKGGRPLSALEVHDAAASGQTDKIKVVRGQGKNALTNSFLPDRELMSRFFYLAVDLRNNHLSRPEHFWDRQDGYVSWKDHVSDGLPDLYQFQAADPWVFNFPINQVQVRLTPGPAPDALLCLIRANAPNFATLELSLGDGPWQRLANPYGQTSELGLTLSPTHGSVMTYAWKLAPGSNSLQLRAVNRAGVTGPTTLLQVEYKR